MFLQLSFFPYSLRNLPNGSEEHVGELSLPNIKEPEEKWSMSNTSYVFLDEKDTKVGDNKVEAMMKPAFECTYAVIILSPNDLIWMKHGKTPYAVDFMVYTLWPALIDELKKPKQSTEQLEKCLSSYVESSRGGPQGIPPILEAFAKMNQRLAINEAGTISSMMSKNVYLVGRSKELQVLTESL